MFEPLPALTVAEPARTHLFNGCPTSRYPAADGRYRVYDQNGAFLAWRWWKAGFCGWKNSSVKGEWHEPFAPSDPGHSPC